MLSSGGVLPRPLVRCSCRRCGHGYHASALTQADVDGFYSDEYTVLRVNETSSVPRACAVFELLAEAWGSRPGPARALEIGCGAGSLLSKMKTEWGGVEVQGVEPAPRLVELSRAAGHEVHARAFDTFECSQPYDLVCSVNVLEHFLEPAAALTQIASLLAPEGLYCQITPDGDLPGVELLFYDHVSSFTASSLVECAANTGLRLLETRPLDGALREFRLAVYAKGAGAVEPQAVEPTLPEARQRFLSGIQLSPPSDFGAEPFFIFGAGEMSDLLNAYRPELVRAARAFVVDETGERDLHSKPVISTSDLPPGAKLLVAIHARSLSKVMAKLKDLGHTPTALAWGPEAL